MPMPLNITRSLVAADNGTRIRVDSEPTVPTSHPRYAIVTVRNGFDDDVGILGHLSDPPASPSSPWSGFTTGEQTPLDVDILNNTIGVDNNYVNIGAGVGLAVEVMPIGVGAVRSQTAASSGFFESRFYFMMRAGDSFTGDQPWVVATSAFSYDGAYNFTVVIGPSATEGDVYQCTGSARSDPQTWTITRLANVGARVSGGNIDTTPVVIEVGDTAQTWVEGAIIEVARMGTCASPVSFAPAVGVTMNAISGTAQLTPGSFGRVTKVNGAPNTWDLHVHQAVPQPSLAGHLLASTGTDGVLEWVAAPVTPLVPSVLNDLTDVNATPADADLLTFDSGLGVWKAAPAAVPVQVDNLKPRPMAQVTISTNTYNGFSALHHNTHFRSTSAADVAIAVQPDSFWTGSDTWNANGGYPINPGPMPDGGSIIVGKHAVGNITFVAGPGVVINTPDTLVLNKLHGKVTLVKVGANTWDLEGNLATV